MTTKLTRRVFVTAAGGALVAMAGCAKGGTSPSDEPEPEPEPEAETEPESAAEPEPEEMPAFAGHTALVLSTLRVHEDDQGWGDVDTLSEATYDDQGRMTRKVLETAALRLTIDYDYDDQGRVVEAVVAQADEPKTFEGTWTCAWSDDGLTATWDFSPAEGVADVGGHLEVEYNFEGAVIAKRGLTLGPQNYFEGSASYNYSGTGGLLESVEQREGEPMSQYEQSWVTWLAYDPAGRLSGYRDARRDLDIRWQYDDDNNLVYLEAKVPYSDASYTETFVDGGGHARIASRDLLSGDFTELWATPPADATITLDDAGNATLVSMRLANGAEFEYEASYQEISCPEGFEPTPVASLLDPLVPQLSLDAWMWLDDYALFGPAEAQRANRAWLAEHADEVSTILESRSWVRATVFETADRDDLKVRYAEPIAAYSRAIGGELDWSSTDPYASWLAMSYGEQIGAGGFEYAFADLDNDGTPEMLVRPVAARTMDIWTLGDDGPVLVVAGGFFEGEAQRVEPCEDGFVITSGASGLAPRAWTLTRLMGSEAVSVTTIYGDDQYGYAQMNRDTGEETPVSEGEYLKLYGDHPLLLGLSWVDIEPPVG